MDFALKHERDRALAYGLFRLVAIVDSAMAEADAVPFERHASELVTTDAAPAKRPGRPRKNISGSGGIALPRPTATKED